MNIQKIISLGNEWKKENFHRVYFNPIDIIGLKISTYNTGNISSAELNGEPISNSYAKKLLSKYKGKFFFDINTNEFKGRDILKEDLDELIEIIKEKTK